MKLGDYVEIRARVADREAARTFYQALGYVPVSESDDVLTDGAIRLRLATTDTPDVHLAYYGCDLEAVRAAGVDLRDNVIVDPYGTRALLLAEASDVPMPEGSPTMRPPNLRLGKMGEYSLSVGSFEQTAAFWTGLGFEALHTTTTPYPWGIFTDGLIVLGIHEHVAVSDSNINPHTVPPAITYFAEDMPDRIRRLRREGIDILPAFEIGESDAPIDNGRMVGPGNILFYLFTGEI